MKADPPTVRKWLPTLIAVTILAELSFFQFRLLSFTVIALAGLLFAAWPRWRSNGFRIVVSAVLLVSLFLPFDIALGNYHWGTRRGTSPRGAHFVLFVVGMPMDALIIKEYGEYISAGCAWPSAFPPKWVLVWN